MTKKNIDFCKNLFRKFLKTTEPSDFYVFLDYYSFKVIDLLNNYKSDEAEQYSVMFKEFEEECSKSANPKVKEMSVFFFALSNMLIQAEMANDKEYVELYIKNLMEIVEEDILVKDG